MALLNSSITLRPVGCQELSLEELDAKLEQLLDESKETQQWVIDETLKQGIMADDSGMFSNAAARKLPKPTYKDGTLHPSSRVEIDRAEAQRVIVAWQERLAIYQDLETYGKDTDYKTFKELTGRKYLKRNLFENIVRSKAPASKPEVKWVRVPTSKAATNDYVEVTQSKLNLKLHLEICDIAVNLEFEIPLKLVQRCHSSSTEAVISKPTIRRDKNNKEPVFDFTFKEVYPEVEELADSVLGFDAGVNKMFSGARVYSSMKYSEEFLPSCETDFLTSRIQRDDKELELKRAKNKRRLALGIENEAASLKLQELHEKRDRRVHEQEWLLARDMIAHAKPGETIAIEDLSFNTGGTVGRNHRFRFSATQDHLEHLGNKTGHKIKKNKAAGTTSKCPDCGGVVVLSGRTFKCTRCDWEDDRDYSSGVSNAKRGLGKGSKRLDRTKNRPTPKRPRLKKKPKFNLTAQGTTFTGVNPAVGDGRDQTDPSATTVELDSSHVREHSTSCAVTQCKKCK